jgi:hypothetical protein
MDCRRYLKGKYNDVYNYIHTHASISFVLTTTNCSHMVIAVTDCAEKNNQINTYIYIEIKELKTLVLLLVDIRDQVIECTGIRTTRNKLSRKWEFTIFFPIDWEEILWNYFVLGSGLKNLGIICL